MAPLKLPLNVVSQVDVMRLSRELAALEDFFVSAKARTPGTSMALPNLSHALDTLAKDNDVNLLDEKKRQALARHLEVIYDKAPNFHISFAVEASPKALERILEWMRRNIHPQTLLQVGLQPTIAAGCVLRTTNKIFDMSLRSRMSGQIDYLTQLIKGAADGR
jgi:F0F1-type ATP synthase delta subunit